jgi:hypothetical protein
LLAFRADCRRHRKEAGVLGDMWARAFEQAVRVAGVVAFGCYDGKSLNPVLNVEHAQWATVLVEWLTRKACELIEAEVADTQTERDTKKMLRFIRDVINRPPKGRHQVLNKQGMVPKAQITKRHCRIDKWRRDQILETLVEAGDVEFELLHTSTPTKVYRPQMCE